MKFTHEIWQINIGEAKMIRSFVSPSGAFSKYAYKVFLETARRELLKPRFVRDTTVAGHHYADMDGVVLELH